MSKPLRSPGQATRLAGAAFLALLGAAAPAPAAGLIDLRYVNPESFSDIGRSSADREQVLQALTAHFQLLAQRLPDGQRLRLDVLDIDLAGEIVAGSARDIRVVSGSADWPRIDLRYTLQQDGATLKSGQAQLADMGYLQRLSGHGVAAASLTYEKRLLDAWFAQAIIGGGP